MSFYGKENVGDNIRELYDDLTHCWCRETCAARMRPDWSERNMTLGQCSITSVIVQELLGGRIFGVPLEDGGMHCFNETDGVFFDLTSEQFGNKAGELVYTDKFPLSREGILADPAKKERYELLKARYNEYKNPSDRL